VTIGGTIFAVGMIAAFARFEYRDRAADRRDVLLTESLCQVANSQTRSVTNTRKAAFDAAVDRRNDLQTQADDPPDLTSYPGYADAPAFFKAFIGKVVNDSIARTHNDLAEAKADVDRLWISYKEADAVPLIDCDHNGGVDPRDFQFEEVDAPA
jgi:hypothetical protein